ncbi:hypothetical protein J6590_048006 [Homalodisca vitripennis]|nr:hypothetical protein J6590_048006 [Homalodisca vitripennis]
MSQSERGHTASYADLMTAGSINDMLLYHKLCYVSRYIRWRRNAADCWPQEYRCARVREVSEQERDSDVSQLSDSPVSQLSDSLGPSDQKLLDIYETEDGMLPTTDQKSTVVLELCSDHLKTADLPMTTTQPTKKTYCITSYAIRNAADCWPQEYRCARVREVSEQLCYVSRYMRRRRNAADYWPEEYRCARVREVSEQVV